MGIVLGPNQYGKAQIRVFRVHRETARHEVRDLNVSTSLRGDFTAAHESGDQSGVLPTDTQKNTVFAFAKEGIGTIEEFGLRLADHFVAQVPDVDGARIEIEEYAWDRVPSGGAGHDHSFVQRGGETRTTIVTVAGQGAGRRAWVVSGIQDLVIAKTTGSEFTGFLKDEYTTLAETDDRVLATSLVARWRYEGTGIDFDERHASIRAVMLEGFAEVHSLALQQSLYAMGAGVLERHPEVAEIRFSAPNKHHFEVDLSPFGMENPGEVFIAADRPYGLIEATVTRDDTPDAGQAWLTVPGFC
ncbi:factor-independent urate hydroxylase [Actinomadura sp. 7K507]|uniref:factor-independent urate hydroxylase n=1 Tax=Actinomadura sp. 7K507 TaxID=2530365 RepID=UPI00104FC355|nr:urate oxidase [Actinomadura sp. 7K507]TDC97181.1 urate oxidase [Actinomadura sp. 7K507]